MSKVYLNKTSLSSGCIIRLNDSINTINKVLNYFNYFDIPYDFKKKNLLRETESILRNVKKDLSNVKNWVTDSSSNYESLVNNLNSQANALPTYQFKQRNNII